MSVEIKFCMCILMSLLILGTNQQIPQPVNYKQWLINMAIQDGLKTVDQYVRGNFWYYLRGSTLLDYRVKVTPTHLNYRIIYMGVGGIFMLNSGLNKILWDVQMNNIVKINA